jgi:hypothetical protein
VGINDFGKRATPFASCLDGPINGKCESAILIFAPLRESVAGDDACDV